MDEYEALEETLQKLYDEFMIKFRNQAYLEQLLEEHDRVEQDKTEVSGAAFNATFLLISFQIHLVKIKPSSIDYDMLARFYKFII